MCKDLYHLDLTDAVWTRATAGTGLLGPDAPCDAENTATPCIDPAPSPLYAGEYTIIPGGVALRNARNRDGGTVRLTDADFAALIKELSPTA